MCNVQSPVFGPRLRELISHMATHSLTVVGVLEPQRGWFPCGAATDKKTKPSMRQQISLLFFFEEEKIQDVS